MLELIDIKKDYPAGGGKVEALKGVSLQFRKVNLWPVLAPPAAARPLC